jgi:TRAP-type transport system periplasmic protein
MGEHLGAALTARLIACGVATGLLATGAAAQDSRAMTISIATATLNDAQHEWLKRFSVAIRQSTNGRIVAQIYPGSQLGSIPQMIQQTQAGAIQIWVGPPEFLVGVDPRFEILSVPGLFRDDQHTIATIANQSFVRDFLALGADKGLIGASLFWTGPIGFAMRTPMRTLDDIKGKRVRVLASPFQLEQVARLGGTGVPLSLGDVLPALQRGALDGALGALGVFSALNYETSAKYMTETSHAYIFSEAVLSRRWFETLPPDLQSAVLVTADQARSYVIPWSLDFLDEQRQAWMAKGGEIIHLSDADHAKLMDTMAPIGEDIVSRKPELRPLWEKLVAAAKRIRW